MVENGEIYINNGTFVYDSKKPNLVEEGGIEGGAGPKKKEGGIRGLMHQHARLMKEAALDQQWEMSLLKAQLLDAENTIAKLSGDTKPMTSHSSSVDEVEEGGQFSPSSLLSFEELQWNAKGVRWWQLSVV